ncbi:MAG: DUF433 domain-containing protein [Dehalococcoidia bacterium]
MTTDLLTEEEKMRRVPGIIFVDGAMGRRARVAGTGLEVFEIINGYESVGEDLEGLLEAFHWLKAEQILAALHYYREFPEEIGAILDEMEAMVPPEIQAQYKSKRRRQR